MVFIATKPNRANALYHGVRELTEMLLLEDYHEKIVLVRAIRFAVDSASRRLHWFRSSGWLGTAVAAATCCMEL